MSIPYKHHKETTMFYLIPFKKYVAKMYLTKIPKNSFIPNLALSSDVDSTKTVPQTLAPLQKKSTLT